MTPIAATARMQMKSQNHRERRLVGADVETRTGRPLGSSERSGELLGFVAATGHPLRWDGPRGRRCQTDDPRRGPHRSIIATQSDPHRTVSPTYTVTGVPALTASPGAGGVGGVMLLWWLGSLRLFLRR